SNFTGRRPPDDGVLDGTVAVPRRLVIAFTAFNSSSGRLEAGEEAARVTSMSSLGPGFNVLRPSPSMRYPLCPDQLLSVRWREGKSSASAPAARVCAVELTIPVGEGGRRRRGSDGWRHGCSATCHADRGRAAGRAPPASRVHMPRYARRTRSLSRRV